MQKLYMDLREQSGTFLAFFQVWGGTFDRYYYNDHNRIEKVGGFLGFNVMDRYTCESTYVFEIENYPE